MSHAATTRAARAARAARATRAARAARVALAAVAAAAAAVITGCSASPTQPDLGVSASRSATSPAAAASSTPAVTASTVATPTTPATPQTSATPTTPPTLGQLAGVFAQGQGFGQVEPAKIFNGGDPTGLVTHITWQSWGSRRAIGSGTAEYVGPNQSVATGKPKPATVVAFHLGMCDGKLMYQAVEWYFPGEGQSFDPTHYENICTGSYVPSS